MRALPMFAAHAAILSAVILGTTLVSQAGGFVETDLVVNKSPLTDSNGIVHPINNQKATMDSNLVNPWGLAANSTSPFWVSDNGAGTSTLYNSIGTPQPATPLIVSIPIPGDPLGNKGTPTGVVFNISTGFQISGFDSTGKNPVMKPAAFLFATEDGTILGWNPNVFALGDTNHTAPSTHAIIAYPPPPSTSEAVYKGLAIATDALGTTRLYATNFRAATVEVFDTNFGPATPVGAFTDPKLPRGYAPFNVVLAEGKLIVTYAVQDSAKHDDVAGMSHGIVNTFALNGQSVQRLIQHGQLNSPWGVAVAPTSFGALAGALLIGNFGNGHIDAYNATSGAFIDKVRNPHGQAIIIDGLWSLRVGSDQSGGNVGSDRIFFTAGPNGEQDGLFGVITPSP
jgi:uncharacterized protein (TIGR03118 family)